MDGYRPPKGCLISASPGKKGCVEQQSGGSSSSACQKARAAQAKRTVRDTDPDSLIPVCRTRSLDDTPPLGSAVDSHSGYGTSPTTTTTTTSRPRAGSSASDQQKGRPGGGLFGSFKRPSFLRKRSSSISRDDEHSVHSEDTTQSALEDGDMTPLSSSYRGGSNHHRPPCILEDQPLILSPPESPVTETAPIKIQRGAGGGGGGYGRYRDDNSALSTSPTLGIESETKYLSLRPCCKQCQRAAEKGLETDWVPPLSRSAKHKISLQKDDAKHDHAMGWKPVDPQESALTDTPKSLATRQEESDDDTVNEECSVGNKVVMVDEVELLRQRRRSSASEPEANDISPNEALKEAVPLTSSCSNGGQADGYFPATHDTRVNGAPIKVT